MQSLVSAKWLSENIDNPAIFILDATFKGVNNTDNSLKNYQIKNAHFFDLKKFKNQKSHFPNTYPTPKYFEEEIRKLGVKNEHHIVIYDANGIYAASRAWWLFKLMGHQKISVLNGGLPNWIAKKMPIEEKRNSEANQNSDYQVNFQPKLVVDFDFVKENSKSKKRLLIDARSTGRFNSTKPEPRKELPSGNIPNSINIPYQKVLQNGFLKSNAALKSVFKNVTNSNKPLIFSCGSGITACILMLASEQILTNTKAIYDGSWTEWATKTYI